MRERLYLKNFGPIREMNIDIKPLMVFIGESGSGKSAILKLMSLLRWVHKQNNLSAFLIRNTDRRIFSNNLRTSEIEGFITSDTVIEFDTDGITYKFKNNKFQFSEAPNSEATFDKTVFLSENRGILPSILERRFSLNTRFPYFLEDTFENFNKAIGHFQDFFIESTQLTLSENTQSYTSNLFVKGDDFEIPFRYASSGTKSVAFVEAITNFYTQIFSFSEVLDNEYKRLGIGTGSVERGFQNAKNLSIFIEEPELSLFPVAQQRLISRLIKDCFSENKQQNCTTRLAFATHSPYILVFLNNMLLAGGIGKSSPQKAYLVEKIIPKSYWLTMDMVGAYSIEKGKVVSIMDEEEQLICGDYLDNVSEKASSDFSALLDICYENR